MVNWNHAKTVKCLIGSKILLFKWQRFSTFVVLMPCLPETGFLEVKVLLLLDGKCEVDLLIAKPYEKGRTHQILQYVEKRGIKLVTKLMHFFPNKKCMYWRHFLWLCCLLSVLGSVQVSSNNVAIMHGARTRLEDMPTNQILDAGKMRRFQEFRKPSWRGWCQSHEN